MFRENRWGVMRVEIGRSSSYADPPKHCWGSTIMTRSGTSFLAVSIFFFGVASAAPTTESLSLIDQQDLRRVALELRGAILHEDIARILRHVSRSNGLGCTDTEIPYKQVEKYLHEKKSHLYMSLFDSSRFSTQCGNDYSPEFPAISAKEFFGAESDQTLEIVPHTRNQAQVIFKSRIKGHYQREWEFKKEGKEWKLVYGFIVGNCSCG
jgi:hypothetical protein